MYTDGEASPMTVGEMHRLTLTGSEACLFACLARPDGSDAGMSSSDEVFANFIEAYESLPSR